VFEFLHPKLRKLFAEDIMVKDTKSVGKIDVYIDISGSMSDSCGVINKEGHRISRLDFCKSMVAKLAEMDMLNDVYVFNNNVKKYKKDPISIAILDTSGGTTINKAVESVHNNGVNAIILTDAEDSCNIYSEKAFFIGLQGARFSHFRNETISEYSKNDQVIIFDGSTIKKVDENGNVMK
jgi:predicted metal-dependent peptidase